MNELLICQNLAIGYESTLVKELNFSLMPNKITHIKGSNGSGKTTLIKTILNEIPKKEGSIQWNLSSKEISYLPQITNPSSHFSYTVKEILDIYDTPIWVQKLISISLLETKWIDASGGQKQKVMLLTRVNDFTKTLILDEPFNHLDSKSIQELNNFLLRLIKEHNFSILLISHLDISIPNELLEIVELV